MGRMSAIVLVGCLAACGGVTVTVPLAPETEDRAAKQFAMIPDKANVYL